MGIETKTSEEHDQMKSKDITWMWLWWLNMYQMLRKVIAKKGENGMNSVCFMLSWKGVASLASSECLDIFQNYCGI